MAPINIHSLGIDPEGLSDSDQNNSHGSSYGLLTFQDEPTIAHIDELFARGATVSTILAGRSVIFHMTDPSKFAEIKALPFVQQACAYPDAAALDPHLQLAAGGNQVEIVVTVHDASPVSPAELVPNIQATATSFEVKYLGATSIYATVSRAHLGLVAANAEVKHVGPIPERKNRTVMACQTVQAPLPKEILTFLDYESTPGNYLGAGQKIAICESGFDDGKLDFGPETAFGSNRVIGIVRGDGSPLNGTDDGVDRSGHGTHVASCALGCQIVAAPAGTTNVGQKRKNVDPSETLYTVCGPAPMGSLFVATKPLFDIQTTFELARQAGAFIQSISFGQDPYKDTIQLPYNAETTKLDQYTYDHPDFLVLWCAGNEGDLSTTSKAQIGAEAASKNAVVVGACSSSRKFDSASEGDDGSDTFDLKFNDNAKYKNPRYIANWSSRGPTVEQRLKPDCVAPGIAILGARSRSYDSTELANDEVTYGKSTCDQYSFMSGTSMSTPHVAGCAACLREAFMKNSKPENTPPSAPMLKALLINGTQLVNNDVLIREDDKAKPGKTMFRAWRLPDPPDVCQGYGQINMFNSLQPIIITGQSEKAGHVDMNVRLPEKVPTNGVSLLGKPIPIVVKGLQSIRITLAYNDAPGPDLLIDLDVELKLDGYGTAFKGMIPNALYSDPPVQEYFAQAKPWNLSIPGQTSPGPSGPRTITMVQPDPSTGKLPLKKSPLQKIFWQPKTTIANKGLNGTIDVRLNSWDRRLFTPGKSLPTLDFALVWWVSGEGTA